MWYFYLKKTEKLLVANSCEKMMARLGKFYLSISWQGEEETSKRLFY